MSNERKPQLEYVEKRPRYFDGQYLKVDDFEDEQKYHIDRQRRVSQFLHIFGILEGLQVFITNKLLQITPGAAIDSAGRQILLSSEATYINQSILKSSQERFEINLSELNSTILKSSQERFEINLSELDSTTDYNLSIAWHEEEVAPQVKESKENTNTRFYERPILVIQSASNSELPSSSVLLAVLKGKGSNNFFDLDLTSRQYSGLKLPAEDGNGVTLRSQNGANDRAILSGSLSITQNLSVNGTVGFHSDIVDDYEIFVRGVANGQSQPTLTIGGNVITQESGVKGQFNTTVLKPNGGYKNRTITTLIQTDDGLSWGLTWTGWLEWINGHAADGDVVVLATFKGIFDCLAKMHPPETNWAHQGNLDFENFLISINAHQLAQQADVWGAYPYSLVFVKGQNRSREALGKANGIVEIRTSYNQLTRDGRISADGTGLQIEGNSTIAGKLTSLGKVGIGAAPGTDMLHVAGNTSIEGNISVSGTTIIGSTTINLAAHGGGQLKITNDVNDNYRNDIYKYDHCIRLEAYNANGDGSAAELLITGARGTNVPTLSLLADNTKISGNLSVTGDDNSLTVDGTSTLTGNVGIGGAPGSEKLTVSGNTAIAGSLSTTGDQGDLTISGTSKLNGTTTIASLTVDGTSTLTGNVGIGGDPGSTEKLKVTGDAAIAGSLSTTGDQGDLTISGTSKLNGTTTIASLTVDGTSTLTGNVGIGGDPGSTEKLKVTGDAAIAGSLSTTGDQGDLTISGTSKLNGTTTIAGTLSVIGANGNLTVTGTSMLNGNTAIAGTLSVTGSVGIKGSLWVGTNNEIDDGDNLCLGNNVNNQKFIIHPRTNNFGDFLQITCDNADGTWAWAQGITLKRGGNVGIGQKNPAHKLDVQGNTAIAGNLFVTGVVRATTFQSTNPMQHRMYPPNPRIYQDIFEAKNRLDIQKIGNPSYDDTSYSSTLLNGRKIIRYGTGAQNIDDGAQVTIPKGFNTVWIRVLGERWTCVKAYLLDSYNNKEDLGFWSGGYRSANCYCPDGSLSDSYRDAHQWLPIPVGGWGRVALISKQGEFWISGLAFSTNPWCHAAQSAVTFHWAFNGGNATPWDEGSKNWNSDIFSRINSNTNLELKVPVIPSGRDKLLYLVEHNNNWNGCMHNGVTVNGTPIERLMATYDNPFARHWNSKLYERYIAARIPADLIPLRSRFLRVNIDMSKQDADLYFREIGTHDLDIPESPY